MIRSAIRLGATLSRSSLTATTSRSMTSAVGVSSQTLLNSSSTNRSPIQQSYRAFSDDALEKKFQKSVANLQKVTAEVDNDLKLKLYALYKQATNGPANGDKPSMFDVVAKAKYGAWKALGDMSEEDARKNYISVVEGLLEKSEGVSKEATQEEPPLVFEEKGHVYWIRLNRPKTYNALTPEMYEGIIDALKRAAEDPDIKFVAVKGTGKYFSSGNDLSKSSIVLLLYCSLLIFLSFSEQKTSL